MMATDGETVTFNCSVSGSPVTRIQWRRNARPLASSLPSTSGNRMHLYDKDQKLVIKQVRREDKGMFVSARPCDMMRPELNCYTRDSNAL